MKKKVLIIGKGSSGLRFKKKLEKKYKILNISSKNLNKNSIRDLIFDLIIISSPASFHIKHLQICKKYSDTFLIEKPLTDNLSNLRSLKNFETKKIFVNYNLRELNLIQKFKKFINQIKNKGKLQFCDVYCGSNAINWRKKNFNRSVSFSKKLGGGPILELSHEIDLIYKFFGKPNKIISVKKKISKKTKDVEDIFISQMYFKKINLLLNLNLNFLDNYNKRYFEFNYTNYNFRLDLVNHKLLIINEKKKKIIKFINNLDDTYFIIPDKILNKNYSNLCSFDESKKVSKFILTLRNNSINF